MDIFIHELLEDAVASSHWTASDGTISELWMEQNVEGRGHGQIWKTTPAIVWMDWGETTQNLSHYSWSLCLGVHPGLSEHEAGANRTNVMFEDSHSKYILFLQKRKKLIVLLIKSH
jgi:hypothetical protein